MPSPSIYPFVVACALPILGYAAVFHSKWYAFLLLPVGAIILAFGVYAWGIEPGTAPDETAAEVH